ncbi:MAG: UDP-N-acetylglucosamine 2-epimerase (hydrolyzing) [Phycisphaerae bacterium]|nr:UDP-N-acetylglucosamine 2-epimerase (hydrolyzing) [Phycisphaerae bacterium]
MKSRGPRLKRRRRIAVVTGTRAEYGLLTSTLEAIRNHPDLELQLVVTGMHLLRRFGRTVDVIRRDGFTIAARVRMQRGDDSALDQADGLAGGVKGIAAFLEEAQSDIVVVLGDRIEAFAGALAATTTGRILAHIHGGDLALGDLDDRIRHAITRLAHVHLAASAGAKRRLLRMRESPERVHLVGAPGLDRLRTLLREVPRPTSRSDRALVIQHPIGRSAQRERAVMATILQAIHDRGLRSTIIYPNTDRGHEGIIAAAESFQRRRPQAVEQMHRSLERDRFLRLLMSADVLVGNSSSGVIEANFAGTPVVNVGTRQAGRERGGSAVVDVGESKPSIAEGLKQALRLRPRAGRSSVYGTKPVGPLIAAILARVPLTDEFRRKSLALR